MFVEGGIYHVYNRLASGESVFADPEEAREFIELLRYVKQRDGWTIFAWALMSNHYHVAIRSRAVPLPRGIQHLQGRFSQRINRKRRRTGALWQSRYQAKPINEQRYLDRVILYIHLNPVSGGLVDRPIDHVFGGHREIVKGVSSRSVYICVVDVNSVLDDHYDLVVNGMHIGEVANPEGGSVCYGAVLRGGANELLLKLVATRGKSTNLQISINNDEDSTTFGGSANHAWSVVAP